jgi:hypothetical protein
LYTFECTIVNIRTMSFWHGCDDYQDYDDEEYLDDDYEDEEYLDDGIDELTDEQYEEDCRKYNAVDDKVNDEVKESQEK